MKPYGVDKQARGCCPGHDKYPPEPYGIKRRNTFKIEDRPRKKRARRLLNETLWSEEG